MAQKWGGAELILCLTMRWTDLWGWARRQTKADFLLWLLPAGKKPHRSAAADVPRWTLDSWSRSREPPGSPGSVPERPSPAPVECTHVLFGREATQAAGWRAFEKPLTSLQYLATAVPSGCSLQTSAVPTSARIFLRGMRAISHNTSTRVTFGTPFVIVPVLSNITTSICSQSGRRKLKDTILFKQKKHLKSRQKICSWNET